MAGARTSRIGSQRLPSEDTALHRKVMARKVRKICHVEASQMPTPGSVSKTLMQATRNSVVPKLTARVMVMLPTTYSQPHTQLAMRR